LELGFGRGGGQKGRDGKEEEEEPQAQKAQEGEEGQEGEEPEGGGAQKDGASGGGHRGLAVRPGARWGPHGRCKLFSVNIYNKATFIEIYGVTSEIALVRSEFLL
jgi:hypothetical protein